jgi:hypothetical protein
VKTLFLAGCAFIAICASAHAAPKMLTSQCTETEDHVRTCLAPGEAPWSATRPRKIPPSIPETAMPVTPQQRVPPAAPEAAVIPRPAYPVAPIGQSHTPTVPVSVRTVPFCYASNRCWKAVSLFDSFLNGSMPSHIIALAPVELARALNRRDQKVFVDAIAPEPFNHTILV